MSGKPYPEGVTKVLDMISKMRELEPQIKNLHAEIVKLQGMESEYNTLKKNLAKDLGDMDLDAQGNFGWEGRFTWFLSEFHKQITAKVK